MSEVLNISGLLLNAAGVILLFHFGMPFRTRTGGKTARTVVLPNAEGEVKAERRFDLLGSVGLLMILLGTLLQICAITTTIGDGHLVLPTAIMGKGMRVVIGLLVTVALGFTIGPLLTSLDRQVLKQWGDYVPVPKGVPEAMWVNEVVTPTNGGGLLGRLEGPIFFAALWMDAGWPILVSWLAFKVASKWNNWTQVGDAPRLAKDCEEPIENMRARIYVAAFTNRRFVVGTAENIVAALVGVAAAHIWPVGG